MTAPSPTLCADALPAESTATTQYQYGMCDVSPVSLYVVPVPVVVVTSVDNLLRPFLVPKSAHLHPALMLLAVFAGLKMFGFWGIVLGPVLMIVIVTTISVYLVVYKDASADSLTGTSADPAEDEAERQVPWWRRILPGKPKLTPTAKPEPEDDPEPAPA